MSLFAIFMVLIVAALAVLIPAVTILWIVERCFAWSSYRRYRVR